MDCFLQGDDGSPTRGYDRRPSLAVTESADNLVHVGCIATSLGGAAYCNKARIAALRRIQSFAFRRLSVDWRMPATGATGGNLNYEFSTAAAMIPMQGVQILLNMVKNYSE